jgi:hypothetical protein
MANSHRRDQVRQLREKRTNLSVQRDRFRVEKSNILRDASVPDLLEGTNVLTVSLHNLAPQVTALEVELSQAQASLVLLRQQQEASGLRLLPEMLQALSLDPILQWLQMQLLELRIGPDPADEETEPGGMGAAPRKSKAVLPPLSEIESSGDRSESALPTSAPAAQAGEVAGRPTSKPAAKAQAQPDSTGAADARSRQQRARDRERRMEAIKAEIQAREKFLIDTHSKAILSDAESRVAIVLERLTKLRDQYRSTSQDIRDLRTTVNTYNQLEAQDKSLSETINTIDTRVMDLEIVEGYPPLMVMSLAGMPSEPSMPRWETMLPIGAILGLIVGVVLSVVRAVRRRRVVLAPVTPAPPPPGNDDP